MKNISLICSAIVISGLASPAIASDFSGMMTIVLGIPVMVIAAITYGVLAAFRELHRTVYNIAAIAFVLLFIFGLVLAGDAITLARRADHLPMYLYFGLFGLVIFSFVVVFSRYQSHRERLRKQSGR
jgi:undecaprenyl pyrophosphate phosphatase UppP